MSWPVIYRAERPGTAKVGDMWPIPWAADHGDLLGQNYHEDHADKRPPLMVALPSFFGGSDWTTSFMLDRVASDKKPGDPGWKVVIEGELVDGRPVDITVKPSIHCKGSYHGYITAGQVTDDIDGRKYPEYDEPKE